MNNLYIKFYEQMSINTVSDFLLIKIFPQAPENSEGHDLFNNSGTIG